MLKEELIKELEKNKHLQERNDSLELTFQKY